MPRMPPSHSPPSVLAVRRRSPAAAGLATYPGLAHRMEEVGRAGKVLFVNDSKATNADAAARALLCFDNISWIVGGRPKEGGIDSLAAAVSACAQRPISSARSSDDFARTLDGPGSLRALRHARCRARSGRRRRCQRARAKPVVLLSPACASYDQFANFERRGDRFRTLVSNLLSQHASS